MVDFVVLTLVHDGSEVVFEMDKIKIFKGGVMKGSCIEVISEHEGHEIDFYDVNEDPEEIMEKITSSDGLKVFGETPSMVYTTDADEIPDSERTPNWFFTDIGKRGGKLRVSSGYLDVSLFIHTDEIDAIINCFKLAKKRMEEAQS